MHNDCYIEIISAVFSQLQPQWINHRMYVLTWYFPTNIWWIFLLALPLKTELNNFIIIQYYLMLSAQNIFICSLKITVLRIEVRLTQNTISFAKTLATADTTLTIQFKNIYQSFFLNDISMAFQLVRGVIQMNDKNIIKQNSYFEPFWYCTILMCLSAACWKVSKFLSGKYSQAT